MQNTLLPDLTALLDRPSQDFIQQQIGNLLGEQGQLMAALGQYLGKTLDYDGINAMVTHLGYRTTTIAHYTATKQALGALGWELLGEVPINQRPISTWKAASATFAQGQPWILELIAPKPHNTYPEGLQILALLLPDQDFRVFDVLTGLNLPGFDRSGLENQGNPHVEVALSSGAVVKFHLKTLEAVVQEELAQGQPH